MNEEIKIEKNVPLPTSYAISGFTQALRRCKVGDSFIMPEWKGYYYSMAFRENMKITQRTQPDGKCRIWRKA